MKKNIFNLFAAGIVLSLAACNNSSDNTGANGDSANLNQDSLTPLRQPQPLTVQMITLPTQIASKRTARQDTILTHELVNH